jgi:hypothetical protein
MQHDLAPRLAYYSLLNFAVTLFALFMVTSQVSVPEQMEEGDQPENVDPISAVAERTTEP